MEEMFATYEALEELFVKITALAHAQGMTVNEAVLEALALWIDQNSECIDPTCSPWLDLEKAMETKQ